MAFNFQFVGRRGIIPALTATVAELNQIAGLTAGTAEASKAVVLDANAAIDAVKTAALHIGTSGSETAVTATGAELNALDISENTETIAEGGTVSATKTITKIVSTGAGAVTLAAPGAAMLGRIKIIEMTGGNHDVTLALTNITGGSAATTCTFTNTNEALVLVGGTNKWHVIAESGVVLS